MAKKIHLHFEKERESEDRKTWKHIKHPFIIKFKLKIILNIY